MIEIKEAYTQSMLAKKNVIGVALGKKRVGGEKTDEDVITVLVTTKVSAECLDPKDIVPATLCGVPTDVIEVGYIQAPPPVSPMGVWTARHRPPVPGISIGHKDITAGTFGCMVVAGDTPVMLSNNHVFANSNKGKVGDPILQPGRIDGGVASDEVGQLLDFAPIVFPGNGNCKVASTAARLLNKLAALTGHKSRLTVDQSSGPMNQVDAAVAVPNVPVSHEIIEIGAPVGIRDAELGMKVQKCGRTTGHTYDEVEQMEATVQVSYGPGKVGLFNHQLIMGPMSAGGDSGSAILDMDKYVVGLLFAGSDRVTIASPIQLVLDQLCVRLYT